MSDRSRVYFDIEIAGRKEGRITFELVSPSNWAPTSEVLKKGLSEC